MDEDGLALTRRSASDQLDKVYPNPLGSAGYSLQTQMDLSQYFGHEQDPEAVAAFAKRFPKFQDVECYECVLNSGEVLFLPFGYWHQVRPVPLLLKRKTWPNPHAVPASGHIYGDHDIDKLLLRRSDGGFLAQTHGRWSRVGYLPILGRRGLACASLPSFASLMGDSSPTDAQHHRTKPEDEHEPGLHLLLATISARTPSARAARVPLDPYVFLTSSPSMLLLTKSVMVMMNGKGTRRS